MIKKDVAVIGSGPGGYVASLRLAQLGKSVVLIEKDKVGGLCLNYGCIPSKTLIHVVEILEKINQSKSMGISVSDVSIDLTQTQIWKDSVVHKLTKGIEQLLKAAKIKVLFGKANFASNHTLNVELNDNSFETIEFEKAIIATGSSPIQLPNFSVDHLHVFEANQALNFTSVPQRLMIIGGGVIGLEIGMIFQKLGSSVVIVEATNQLLPGVDFSISKTIERICKQRNMQIYLSTKAIHYEFNCPSLLVTLQTQEEKVQEHCNIVLVAVGRKPNVENLGLNNTGLLDSQKKLSVTEYCQTCVPHIYAIGDVTGPPLLAHKASKQAIIVAEHIAHLNHCDSWDKQLVIPSAIFTDPEISSVGMTEMEAKNNNIDYVVGKFPFAASGRAMATNSTEGFVKIVAQKNNHQILGIHIIGPSASEMMSEASLAMKMNATLTDLVNTIHPHPTYSECLMEAAEACLGKAIHIPNRK